MRCYVPYVQRCLFAPNDHPPMLGGGTPFMFRDHMSNVWGFEANAQRNPTGKRTYSAIPIRHMFRPDNLFSSTRTCCQQPPRICSARSTIRFRESARSRSHQRGIWCTLFYQRNVTHRLFPQADVVPETARTQRTCVDLVRISRQARCPRATVENADGSAGRGRN